MIATASQDLTAQLTRMTLGSPSSSPSKVLATLHLHTSTVSSISTDASSKHLLTSSWDGLIGLWDTSVPSTDEIPEPTMNERDRKKRRKLDGESDKQRPMRKAPLKVLKSHTGRVSKAIFALTTEERTMNTKAGKAYSCGFDSTVRVWDLEHGVCEHTIVGLISLALRTT